MTTEKDIRREVGRFDLAALLQLLRHRGYGDDQILFRSHASLASQARFIQDIRFRERPRQAIVYLNFGLLCAQTPLPTYFQKKVDSGHVDDRAFRDFIGFFDHQVIGQFVQASYPDRSSLVFSDFEKIKRSILTMIDLRCVATQQWLFSLVFPELDVTVEKAVLGRGLVNEPITLGRTKLGSDAVFGRQSKVPVTGIRINLYSDDEQFQPGAPWPQEIRSRLDSLVFPLLAYVGADLEIFLVIRTQRSFAKLQKASFLGYDKIRGGDDTYRRLRIFSGHLSE